MAALGRTMDDLRAPAATWASEIQNYEQEKRRAVDEGLVNNRQVRVTGAQVKLAERCFDPLLQRYRDNSTELQQRTLEERDRVSHLNRAYDISILRGQPFNIVSHESKIEALAPGQDPMRQGHEKPRIKDGRPGAAMPDSALDYNIVSNLPHEHHHWARPEARPHIATKMAKSRVVPPFLVKDFDILTNKYHDCHDERAARDRHLGLLEATSKYQKRNRFDPLTQQFNDPRAEELATRADHARDVERTMREANRQPPTVKGRESNHYDIISHEIHDPEVIGMYDANQAERKERFKNRYIVEHNLHKQDVKGDHINESRKLNRIAPERYQEDGMRGYDILNNQRYGTLHHEKLLHEPSTKPRPSAWDKIENGHQAKPQAVRKDVWLADGAYLEPLEKHYYADGRCNVDRHARAAEFGEAPASSGRGGVSLKASASAPSFSSQAQAFQGGGEAARTPSGHSEPSRRSAAESSARRSRAGASLRREEGEEYRPQPMPPGQTAPRRAIQRSPEPGALVQVGARAMSESASATHLRSGDYELRSGPPSYAGSRAPSNRHSEPAPGATLLGPQATLKGAPPGMTGAAVPRGTAAPPAPVIPGSPTSGSVYSRRI